MSKPATSTSSWPTATSLRATRRLPSPNWNVTPKWGGAALYTETSGYPPRRGRQSEGSGRSARPAQLYSAHRRRPPSPAGRFVARSGKHRRGHPRVSGCTGQVAHRPRGVALQPGEGLPYGESSGRRQRRIVALAGGRPRIPACAENLAGVIQMILLSSDSCEAAILAVGQTSRSARVLQESLLLMHKIAKLYVHHRDTPVRP